MSEESAAKTPTTWDVPAIDGSDGKGYLTAGRLQELQKDAFEEAWKKGHEEGVAAGQQAVQRAHPEAVHRRKTPRQVLVVAAMLGWLRM